MESAVYESRSTREYKINQTANIDSGRHRTPLEELIDAAAVGDTTQLSSYLTKKKYTLVVNQRDVYELYTPLIWAAKEGYADAVELLCKCEDVDIDMSAGWNESTALIRATERGHLSVVKILIKYKANVNLQNKYGMTALMLAAELCEDNIAHESNYISIIDCLIEAGADINSKNKDEYTALILAAGEGNNYTVEKLLQYPSIDIEAKNKFGKTALILSCEFGHEHVVRTLVKYNANIEALSKRKLSSLMLACVKGRLNIVNFLLEKGADVRLTTETNGVINSALSMACAGGHIDIVKALIDFDSYICDGNMTPLMNACKNTDSVNIVKVLIEQGIVTSESLHEKDCDGNTCLMLACRSGNIDVVCELLDVLNMRHMYRSTSSSAFKSYEVSEYWAITNKEGSTAVNLLANYYKENEDKLGDFLKQAILRNQERPYLLSMLKDILPGCKSPLGIMKKYNQTIKYDLLSLHGHEADIQLIGALVNIAAAVKKSAIISIVESNDLLKILEEFEDMIKLCMTSSSMEDPKNVTKVLLGIDDLESLNYPDDVINALAFVEGPLKTCIDYDLTKLLATPQLITHVDRVFRSSLKYHLPESIRRVRDLFQLRSGCSTYRFNPLIMFIFESFMKVIFLIAITLTSLNHSSQYIAASSSSSSSASSSSSSSLIMNTTQYICSTNTTSDSLSYNTTTTTTCSNAANTVCTSTPTSSLHGSDSYLSLTYYFQYTSQYTSFWEYSVIVMCVTSLFYELGEILNKSYKLSHQDYLHHFFNIIDSTVSHFSDKWNVIDLLTIIQVLLWIYYRYFVYTEQASMAHSFLAMATISLSLGILRFQSMWQHTGQLIVMVFEMIYDLGSFLAVFMSVLLGFGIAFHTLFPQLENGNFSTMSKTFLTLFDAALGQHDFDIFTGTSYDYIGIILFVFYIVLVMIVLLNLVIARMSATHERIDNISLEVWAKVQAANVEEFILITDRNPLCMLPAPLNLISITAAIIAYIIRGRVKYDEDDVIMSIAGTTSDKITSALFSPISAVREFWLINAAIWTSSIPRENQLTMTILALIFLPVWIIFLWIVTLISIIYEQPTYIHVYTRRIIFHNEITPAFVLEKPWIVITYMISLGLIRLIGMKLGCLRVLLAIWTSTVGAMNLYLLDEELTKSLTNLLKKLPSYTSYIEKHLSVLVDLSNRIQTTTTPITMTNTNKPTLLQKCIDIMANIVMICIYFTLAVFNLDIILFVWICIHYLSNKPQIHIEPLRTPNPKSNSNADNYGNMSPQKFSISNYAVTLNLPRHLHLQSSDDDDTTTNDKGSRVSTSSSKSHKSTDRRTRRSTLRRTASLRTAKTPHNHTTTIINNAQLGKLRINLIRGELYKTGLTYFGRKVNPYVLIIYNGEIMYEGKPVIKGGTTPLWNQNNIEISLVKDCYTLTFEVCDAKDTLSDTSDDELLLRKEVNIREWIANKRFEGSIPMDDYRGKPAELIHDGKRTIDNIQVDVRVIYKTLKDLSHDLLSSTTTPSIIQLKPELHKQNSVTSLLSNSTIGNKVSGWSLRRQVPPLQKLPPISNINNSSLPQDSSTTSSNSNMASINYNLLNQSNITNTSPTPTPPSLSMPNSARSIHSYETRQDSWAVSPSIRGVTISPRSSKIIYTNTNPMYNIRSVTQNTMNNNGSNMMNGGTTTTASSKELQNRSIKHLFIDTHNEVTNVNAQAVSPLSRQPSLIEYHTNRLNLIKQQSQQPQYQSQQPQQQQQQMSADMFPIPLPVQRQISDFSNSSKQYSNSLHTSNSNNNYQVINHMLSHSLSQSQSHSHESTPLDSDRDLLFTPKGIDYEDRQDDEEGDGDGGGDEPLDESNCLFSISDRQRIYTGQL